MVTGATGAIGEAIARGLAGDRESTVVLAVRDTRRGEESARRIRDKTGNPQVHVELVDVGSRASIDALRSRWRYGLHTLVNNAAIAPRSREVTDEGVERQLAVNVLGYTRMIDAFADLLAQERGSRVVNVASHWAGDLDIDDLEFERRPYDNDAAYRQSKQANRMSTVSVAERLAPRGIDVNACHPGVVKSNLTKALGFGGSESPDEGAATPLWLARHAPGVTGRFFSNSAEVRCAFAQHRAAIDALDRRISTYG